MSDDDTIEKFKDSNGMIQYLVTGHKLGRMPVTNLYHARNSYTAAESYIEDEFLGKPDAKGLLEIQISEANSPVRTYYWFVKERGMCAVLELPFTIDEAVKQGKFYAVRRDGVEVEVDDVSLAPDDTIEVLVKEKEGDEE